MTDIPHTSTEYITVEINAIANGQPVDPTSGSAALAFLAGADTEPDESDWVPATWGTSTRRGVYQACCLVGPGGTVALDPGQWWPWVRVQLPPEDVQRRAVGTLTIT